MTRVLVSNGKKGEVCNALIERCLLKSKRFNHLTFFTNRVGEFVICSVYLHCFIMIFEPETKNLSVSIRSAHVMTRATGI
jgi:hypothetical protein